MADVSYIEDYLGKDIELKEFNKIVGDYVIAAKQYWSQKFDDFINNLESSTDPLYEIKNNTELIKSSLLVKIDIILGNVKAYLSKIKSLENKFIKNLYLFITYRRELSYKPYLNSDYPSMPIYTGIDNLKGFFSYYDRISVPNYRYFFELKFEEDTSSTSSSVSTSSTTTTTTSTIQINVYFVERFEYKNFIGILENAYEKDNERLDNFKSWFESLDYFSRIGLWINFAKNKIPNTIPFDNDKFIEEIEEKYGLNEIRSDFNFNIPGL